LAERVDAVVIGGGQAGLATSFYLTERSIDHLVLERGRVAESWRGRWDSFTFVIPNWACEVAPFRYKTDNPKGFLSRDEIIGFFEAFAAAFDPPIRRADVFSIGKENGTLHVETSDGEFEAGNVIVATGAYPRPHKPAVAAELPEELTQLDTNSYRNPDALPAGNILVCGAGQSGVQIAEDLVEAGRAVYVAAGRCGWAPRRYRGKDTSMWLNEMGFLDQTVDKLESPADRLACNVQATGRAGGHDINLRLLGERGVRLFGRLEGVSGSQLSFSDDLPETLRAADDQALKIVGAIDHYIETTSIDAPPPEDTPGIAAARTTAMPQTAAELDLREAEVNTVIWTTGFRQDLGWIHLSPLIDQQGFPIQRRGVSEHPGLYFVGLPWLHRAKSSLILGVGEDAEYVASHVAERLASA